MTETQVEQVDKPEAEAAPDRNQVFISFTHLHGFDPASALWHELGDDVAFLDHQDIRTGEEFVDRLIDAILAARVVVMFIDETYFERPYCWFEFELATYAYEVLVDRGKSEQDLATALNHLVIVLPECHPPDLLEVLPLRLQKSNWVEAKDTPALARLVRERMEQNEPIESRLVELVEPDPVELRAFLKDRDMPRPPRKLSVKHYSRNEVLPDSIGTDFRGRRSELWRVHHELDPRRRDARRTVVLTGAAGVGKTTLAAEYLWRFGSKHFPGGLFWVRADSDEEGLREQLFQILCTLRTEPVAWESFKCKAMQEVAQQVREALEIAAADGPVLYVVDNVPEPSENGSLPSFETWCPAPDSVSLLVTTCLQVDFRDVTELCVDVLPPSQARALLQGRSGRGEDLTPAQWDEITDWVGRVPHALVLLNRLLASERPKNLLDRAHKRIGPLNDLRKAAGMSKRSIALRCVTEAMSYSYARLPPHIQRVGRLLAQFSADAIPDPLFNETLEVLDPTLDAVETIDWLLERSFVTRARDTGEPSCVGTMSPVLADFLVGMADHAEAELRLACLALTSVMTAESCRNPQAWSLLDACRPHAEHALGRAAGRANSWEPATRTSAISLGLRIVALLRSEGRLSAAEEAGRRVEALASRTETGEPGPQTLAARSALAETLRARGQLREARSWQTSTVALSKQNAVLGPAHPDTLTYEAQLAGTMSAQGDGAEACRKLREVVKASETTLGAGHPDTLSHKQQLATVLAATEELTAAVDLQREVVEGAEVAFGPGHRFLLRSRANLVVALAIQGELDEAHSIQKEVVEAASQLPARHPDRLDYEMLLGQILAAKATDGMASWDDVIAHQRSLLGVIENDCAEGGARDGDSVLLMARVRMDLGFTLCQQGDLQQARQELEMAIDAIAPGGKRTDEALLAWTLFVVLVRLGSEDAQKVRATHLDWLLAAPPEDLDAEQDHVAAMLRESVALSA